MTLNSNPIPSKTIGSFNIPDVQKSILGINNKRPKITTGFTFEIGQIALNIC